ncbi:MAG: sigma-54 dependent transcriptional regulator [Gemmatimonadaceae bacterium]
MGDLLIVDDEPLLADSYARFLSKVGHTVRVARSGEEALAAWRERRPDVTLLDLRLPDMTGFDVYARVREQGPVVIMVSGHADVPLAVRAVQEGVENFLTKPVELPHLGVAVERALEKVRLRQLSRYLTERRTSGGSVAIGSSPRMHELAAQVELLAASERTTVLLLGESGTGKGRVAEMIHAHSPRAHAPLVEVNCAAHAAEALDAELFGIDDLAGDRARPGLLEVAAGGSLFVDEIGALPPPLQSKLLRVLEGKGFRRAGGMRELTVDVRIIAATNKDLVQEVNAGNFREDLYYKLSVMPLTLPPLRARAREDLVELIGRLMDELAPHLPAAPREVSEGALDALLRYAWPGNIRELRNVLERGMIVGRGEQALELSSLPSEVRGAFPGATAADRLEGKTLADVEREHVVRTLRLHDGNRTHAARELGISRATLIKKIKEYGLPDA